MEVHIHLCIRDKWFIYPKPILETNMCSNYNFCILGKALGAFALTKNYDLVSRSKWIPFWLTVSDERLGKKKPNKINIYIKTNQTIYIYICIYKQEQIKLLIMSIIYHFPNKPHLGKIRKVIRTICGPYGTA